MGVWGAQEGLQPRDCTCSFPASPVAERSNVKGSATFRSTKMRRDRSRSTSICSYSYPSFATCTRQSLQTVVVDVVFRLFDS